MMLYLLHIEPPYKGARHYLGFVDSDYPEDLDARLGKHRGGQGAKLTKAAVKAGCELILVATFPGDRIEERRIKRQNNGPRICPRCCAASGKATPNE